MRLEVVKQLAKIQLDQVFDSLVTGLNDEDARVRRAVVEALTQIKTNKSYQQLKSIVKNGDASYYVEAAAVSGIGDIAAANANSDRKPTEEKVIKLLKWVLAEKRGWNEVVRSGAISALSKMKTSEAALNQILKYTVIGVSQTLRLSAIRSLGTISTAQSPVNLERILQRLTELSRENFS